MLDKLPYVFKGWHLKRKYVHRTIKMLQVEYGSKAPSMLRYHKHTRIETSTTWGEFYCSLCKKLINLLLNNRIMSCCHLDIKALEVTEQGRMGSKLKMVTPNHIKHKPVDCNASPLIKKFEKHTNLKVADVDDEVADEVEDSGTSGVLTPMPPFSSLLSRTGGDTATSTSCHLDEPHSHSPSEAS